MYKIIVCGICGKMGRELISVIDETKDIQLIGAIEARDHPNLGENIAKIEISSNLEKFVQKAAVVVEFTTPSATLEHLEIAREKSIPMVIGTTGFKDEEYSIIEEVSQEIPILLSPNMSVGINLMYNLVRKASEVLQGKNFDQEIIELHHRQKKDAPSGTAKKIAEIVAKQAGKDLSQSGVYGRRGTVGERREEEIGIHAVRGGTVVGEHTVIFAGNGERLEITHRAESRRIFALGAILAARFITQKEKGLYDLQDALGIRETV